MIGLHEDPAAMPPPSHAPALAAKIFSDHGWLRETLGLEYRPQQERMARAVAAALAGDEPLLFEAGTGVGKSLAYLVPGIIQAVDQGRPMIVSTHTISLQEQIETQDLPLCRRLFAAVPALKPYANFKSAVLVGKANYLCATRLAQALQGGQQLFPSAGQAELQRIAGWAQESRDGLRHELSPPPSPEVWETVNADSSLCSRKHCDAGRCFYQRARARLRQANVIIVNHSLLFALLNAGGADQGGGRGVLFPDDFVVLDEGHTVPEVATEHFGLRLNSFGLDRLLKHLWNPRNSRGLMHRHGGAREKQLVEDALDAAEQFFGFLRETLLARQPVVRARAEGFAEPWLDAPLGALIKAVGALADKFDEGRDRDELLEQKGRLTAYRTGVRQFLSLEPEDHVHWLERTGRQGQIVTLRAAPLDVAPRLREQLLQRRTAVVFTSATLAMGGSIEPFQRRIGAEDARAIVVASPFDFERNMRVYVAADMPPPSPGGARLDLDALTDYLEFCTLRVPGGSLVLFTNYQDMRRCAETLDPVYEKKRRPFHMQGADASRTELTRRMRQAGNAILFGTDSFWTGVDVPGQALAQVVITRLPFDVPTHPIAEARAEWIRENGGNPFNDLTLPDALVKFRQGAGRLIRTQTDRGLVTVLDSRVLTKAYGRLFLECLPKREFVRLERNNREERFKPFA